MAGELNGTHAVLHDDTGEIIGQMEFTITYAGTLIDTSNKSAGDYITFLDGELSGKQLVIAGTLVFNSDLTYIATRVSAIGGIQGDYTFDFGVDPTDIQLTFTGTPNAMSDAVPHGDKVSTSITFSSSGAYTVGVVGP